MDSASLPRGTSNTLELAPAASAGWAAPEEICRHQYQAGALYLGVQPAPEGSARTLLRKLGELEDILQGAGGIDATWRAQRLQEISQHRARLERINPVMIGSRDDRHVLTIAGSRAGKGISCITPNLILYPGSVVVIDPKGENARITAARRGAGSAVCEGMGQSVTVLDPYNTTGLPETYKGSWNPLDVLNSASFDFIDRAASIAAALVVVTKPEDAHFDESARQFIKALILYVALHYEGDDRSLLTVHNLLLEGPRAEFEAWKAAQGAEEVGDLTAFDYLLESMKQERRFEGVISGAAATLDDMGDRERGSVLSTARRNLEWIERPAMQAVLKRSTIQLEKLKSDPNGQSLYLCLPPQRMADCGRWLRMVIAACLESCYDTTEPPASGHPVLFLLEEFPILEHMKIIETAAGYAAGFGVKLWVIIQDLSQLKRHYKDGWETFVGNAGVIQAFGNSDATTLDYLSKRLGQVEISQSVRNDSTSLTATSNDPGAMQRFSNLIQNRGQASIFTNPFSLVFDQKSTGESATTSSAVNQQIQKTPLLLPDEIERFFSREMMAQIVSIKGLKPFALGRVAYFEAPEFLGLYVAERGAQPSKEEAFAARDHLLAARRKSDADALNAAASYAQKAESVIRAATKAP